MSRLAEAASAVPLGTLVVIATCVALHVSVYLFGLDLSWVMINAYYVVYKWEVYRLLSSALFHMGLMHIAFNMMSAHLMGASLVRAARAAGARGAALTPPGRRSASSARSASCTSP